MSTTRRVIAATLAVVAAAVLAGCDSKQVGAAVVVGDDRLTVAELHDKVQQVQRLDGFDVSAAGGMAGFQRELLTRHIQHELFLRLAEREGIEVTEATVDDKIEEYQSQAPEGDFEPLLAQSGYTRESFRDGVMDQLIAEAYLEENDGDQRKLADALIEVSDEVGVEVNPRFGAWSDDLSVTGDTGSISTPASAADDEGEPETPASGQ